MPTSAPPATTDARSELVGLRLESVDLLRGAVMVAMVLDHVCDYFTDARVDPTDLLLQWPVAHGLAVVVEALRASQSAGCSVFRPSRLLPVTATACPWSI
jgi:uncharacterized membrane protein